MTTAGTESHLWHRRMVVAERLVGRRADRAGRNESRLREIPSIPSEMSTERATTCCRTNKRRTAHQALRIHAPRVVKHSARRRRDGQNSEANEARTPWCPAASSPLSSWDSGAQYFIAKETLCERAKRTEDALTYVKPKTQISLQRNSTTKRPLPIPPPRRFDLSSSVPCAYGCKQGATIGSVM